MRISVFAFALAALALSLSACRSNGDLSLFPSSSNSPPTVQQRNYQNIATLPLNQGLPLKYSRLQLLCEQTPSYAIWPAQGHDQPKIVTEVGAKQVVWDLLSDLKEKNSLSLGNTYPSLDYGYQIDIEIKLTTEKVTMEDGTVLDLTNGVSLVGQTKGHLDYLDAVGKIMTAESTYTAEGSIFATESTTSKVISSTFKLNKTDPNPGLLIHCSLEAELNTEFASDSKVDPQN